MQQPTLTSGARLASNDPVHELVRLLKDHAEAQPADSQADRLRLTSLRLGESVLRNAQSRGSAEKALEVAVIGPTQTGKSTVVNMLLGRRLAQVSPLAGFTRHPHGFAMGGAAEATDASLFPGYTRGQMHDDVPADALQYTLQSVDDVPDARRVILWDSPDFDSIFAGVYQRGLLELIGRADAYVVVLSKEKYADLSVWTMLRLLAPLRRPMLIVLNKMTPDALAPLKEALAARLGEMEWGYDRPAIYTLDYDARRAEEPVATNGMATKLRDAVFSMHSTERNSRATELDSPTHSGERAFIRRHWSEWTAPLRAQHAAMLQWQAAVSAAAEQFVAAYRRDYLDHPQRYDSFRRATLELLTLIEIPKLGGALSQVRRAVTWPVRQLFATTKAAVRSGGGATADVDVEAGILIEAAQTMLTTLTRDASRKADPGHTGHAVWRAIAARLGAEEEQLRASFATALRAHHEKITADIHAAAGELYEGLQKSPVKLAALRTARTTLDVGLLVLALKTGGLTPLDAVYAPATFALSSMLVEEMAGLRMGHVARNLKARQLSAVRQTLVEDTLKQALSDLTDRMTDAAIAPIGPDLLARADRELAEGGAAHGE